MKTFKLIVISIILFLGMWIISWDTTFASAEVQTIQIIAFLPLLVSFGYWQQRAICLRELLMKMKIKRKN